jgi:type IV pilus assembly protein PilN
MIRINLLPQAKKPPAARVAASAPSGGTTLWAAIYLAGVLVTGIGLTVVYFVYEGELEEQQNKNRALEQRIAQVKKKSARLDEVKAALARSRELEEVVNELNKARTGPTRVLAELSDILSKGGGPTIDEEELAALRQRNPLAGYNRSWDVKRLWLVRFAENDRRCRISGRGKTNEDVAEFLRRLALSTLFEDVTLQRTQMIEDKNTNLPWISFELTCGVDY